MTRVGSCSRCEGGAPETAFDICEAWRIRAFGGVREDGGISLKVEIECGAPGHCIAFGTAGRWVILFQIVVCEVVAGARCGLEVDECLYIAVRRCSRRSGALHAVSEKWGMRMGCGG